MLPLWATLAMSLLVLLFTVGAFSFAVAIFWMLVARTVCSITRPKTWLGLVGAWIFFGGFALMFGYGAYETSSVIIDGLIGRVADAW